MDAQEDIQQQVQEELGERQREMLLREQLKAIQRELGEDGEGEEADELRERIERAGPARAAREEVERELSRLERTSPQSAEYQVIRTYLETVADLPWNVRTEDKLDLEAEVILDEDHYGLQDVKDRVLEFLAVRQLAARHAVEEVEQGREGRDGEAAGGGTGGGDERLGRARPRRGRSCSSPVPPGWARRRSRRASRGRWGGSTCGSRLAAYATRRTFAATGAPTWERCPAGSCRR
jgi:hypothetical protein